MGEKKRAITRTNNRLLTVPKELVWENTNKQQVACCSFRCAGLPLKLKSKGKRKKKRNNWCESDPHFLWNQGVNWKEQTTDSLPSLRSWRDKMAIPISSRWPVAFYSSKDWLKRWRVRGKQKKRNNWCNRNPHFLWSQGVNWKEQTTTDSLLALRSWCETMAIPISSRWAVVVVTVQRTGFKDEE
jgi:hypothetical protein